MSACGAWAAVPASIVAAVGWLYVLLDAPAVAVGPRVAGALPLQQLAGNAAQPLLALAIVWIPAGAVAALALAAGTGLGRGRRAVACAVVGWVTLVLVGAVSDAAAISESVASHLPAQLSRAGTWVAVLLMAAGALLVGAAPRRGRAR